MSGVNFSARAAIRANTQETTKLQSNSTINFNARPLLPQPAGVMRRAPLLDTKNNSSGTGGRGGGGQQQTADDEQVALEEQDDELERFDMRPPVQRLNKGLFDGHGIDLAKLLRNNPLKTNP